MEKVAQQPAGQVQQTWPGLTWPDLVLTFALHNPQFQTCWLFPTFLSKKWSELTPISLINIRPFHRKVRIRYVEKNHVDKGFKQSLNGKYSYHIYSFNEMKIHWESLETYTMPPAVIITCTINQCFAYSASSRNDWNKWICT